MKRKWKVGARVFVPFNFTPGKSQRWVRDNEGIIVRWRSHKKLLLVQFKFRSVTPMYTSYMTLVGEYTESQIKDLGIKLLD